ncbi:MAG: nodulation protein NodH [Rhodobacteraceae bacterium]|nr:nodulation protein NodH [Paracoccaceae bacterium]
MPNFKTFVIFAEMRTGSNFLEANLNSFAGLHCYGEAFNPHFIGYPKQEQIHDITREMRDKNPQSLLRVLRNQPGVLAGFRFFNDHDPRVLETLLSDRSCAKIILTRNPAESYVSRKIAAATGQWKLTNATHAKTDKIRFVLPEFEQHLQALQAFQLKLMGAMQRSGQSAFYIDYEDLFDVAVINGLAKWLGLDEQIEALNKQLKKQNPEPLSRKVENFADMQAGLAGLDKFNLTRSPNFEPRRGPAIPTYIAAPEAGLLFLPVRSGPEAAVRRWLSAVDGGGELIEGFNQKTLRKWRGGHPGHRSFTVLRHPLARAHTAFCDKILAIGPDSFVEYRKSLRENFKLAIPEQEPGVDYDLAAHRTAFHQFLGYLRSNLAGQTNLRIDPAWASQTIILQGMSSFCAPDIVLREDELEDGLPRLAVQTGRSAPPPGPVNTDPHRAVLEAIYDDGLETAARAAYPRDYELFGFANWG